ncbi:hypothetical protein C0389_00610 [bacterium]|nr:hypothetical protein [bacterium]
MKSKLQLLVSFIIVFLSTLNLSGQTIGKIFSKNEANTLFGPVIESKSITVTDLTNVLSQTNQYVMFLIKDGRIAIKVDSGQLISDGAVNINPTDVFYKFSKSIVKDLLYFSTLGIVNVERRESVFTLTTGDVTLENGLPCPPFCD